jgi:NAD(P)-dependent dehydrogenase (short-subunit alcohol dehydrogenase family)
MKILLIGATGTIGKSVKDLLQAKQHEVLGAAYRGGSYQVDLGSKSSIQALFDSIGKVDAVISVAGLANFAEFSTLSDEDFQLALDNKLMGQVNLVRLGAEYLNKNGSITLTSGVLARQPIPGSTVVAMANGALDAFARAASLEIESYRLNTVAPVFVKETMEMMGMDSSQGVSAADTAKAYLAAVEGDYHGQTLDVTDFIN